jgi:hypothetical protein
MASDRAEQLGYTLPQRGVLFVDRAGELEVVSGIRLRHVLCEQWVPQSPLVWDDPGEDRSGRHPIALYRRVGLYVVKNDVCGDRGALSLEFWREFPLCWRTGRGLDRGAHR